MLTSRPFNKRKAFAVGVVFVGSFGLVKLLQDARYLQKDLHKLSEIELDQRDLEQVKKRFKLSDKEMENLLKVQKERKLHTVNLIETDANFEHKRSR